MKKICGTVMGVSFLFALGVVGGMEHGVFPVMLGFILCTALIGVMFLAGKVGGIIG